MFNEIVIIKFLQRKFPISNGIGDDATILPTLRNKNYIVSKDLLIEDIHFRRDYFDAESLAHKAIHVNLSDIAAMSGKPCYVLLGIAIPKTTNKSYINRFLKSFVKLCNTYKVFLIGGDTVASSDKFTISVTVIGVANRQNLKLRSGANTDDIICVAGNLGYAHVGLIAFETKALGLSKFKKALLKPIARIQEGLWLGKLKAVTSLIDISDGLLVDLKHLCKSSQLTAEIHTDELPITKQFKQACKLLNLAPLDTQLTGGEDYGLLLTIKSQHYSKIAAKFLRQFDYPLKAIGKIKSGQAGKISLIKNNKKVYISLKSFSHFGESI